MHLFIVNLPHKQMAVKWYQVSRTKLQQNCHLFMSEVHCLKEVYSSNVHISSFDYKRFINDLNIVSFEDSENRFQIFCEIVRISSFRGKIMRFSTN